ncbi:MAG: class I SAM-dependent methyltransferase [Patescibacteria group bacterium]
MSTITLYDQMYARILSHRRLPKIYVDFVDQWLPMGSTLTVLEIGAADGWLTRHMKARTGKRVYGMDINPSILDVLKVAGVTLVVGDAAKLPYRSGSMDRIVSVHTLEHIPDIGGAMKEMARVLSKKGKMLHIVPSPHVTKAEGALFGSLARHGWNLVAAWREAHALHVHNFHDRKTMETLVRRAGLRITHAHRQFVLPEFGFSWVYEMEKSSKK